MTAPVRLSIGVFLGAFEVPVPGEVFRKTTQNLTWKMKILFYLVER